MDIKTISDDFSVSGQLRPEDVDRLADQGIKSIICNRPDGEAEDQPAFEALAERARQRGIAIQYLPVVHDRIGKEDLKSFEAAYEAAPMPLHAYCRTGLRSTTLWTLMRIRQGEDADRAIGKATEAGYDFSKFPQQFAPLLNDDATAAGERSHAIVIIGAGAAGISVAASLLARRRDLDVAIIDPADKHYYQPGFTLIGGGVFKPEQTVRPMAPLIPAGVQRIRAAVRSVAPEQNALVLDNGERVIYQRLVVCPGLTLHWDGVEGLRETLGRNGVTSNYHPDHASYTWELVSRLRSGRAVFTQPPMPIKCAGAPQKALYLACDHWRRQGVLGDIRADFFNAGQALFGVKDYVPALQSYIDKYHVDTHYGHNLVKVDGPSRTAWFEHQNGDGNPQQVEVSFDMLHVCPPQRAPDFIRDSSLADEAGWVAVDPHSLRHTRFANVWALGDVAGTANAKTAAAIRKQAPVVAANIAGDLDGDKDPCAYGGYGACPLTVERGKVVMAEFAYGGKLDPTLPRWILDGTRPTRLGWQLKVRALPVLYWDVMLKGRELMVEPEKAT